MAGPTEVRDGPFLAEGKACTNDLESVWLEYSVGAAGVRPHGTSPATVRSLHLMTKAVGGCGKDH